jgi:hypothetical protein
MSNEATTEPGSETIVPPARQEPGSVETEGQEIGEANGRVGLPNVLDQINEIREELKGQHHLIEEIPGYKGLLAIRFNNVGTEVTESVGKKLRKELKARGGEGEALLGSIETIISATDMILVKDPGHAACIKDDKGEPLPWRPIDPTAQPPVRWDRRLQPLLKFTADGTRESVLSVFGPNEHGILQMSLKLSRWLGDVTRDVDEDFLGE